GKDLNEKLKRIEETLYQTKNRSGQDPLNYPIRLNNKLAALASEADASDYRPTEQVKAVYEEITTKINEQLNALKTIFAEDIPKFHDLMRQKQVDAVPLTEAL